MKITKKDLLKWKKNKLVNPITGRKIKKNSCTYKKFNTLMQRGGATLNSRLDRERSRQLEILQRKLIKSKLKKEKTKQENILQRKLSRGRTLNKAINKERKLLKQSELLRQRLRELNQQS